MADSDTDKSQDTSEGATGAVKEATQTVTSEMKKVAREAAIVVLTPVVKKAATGLTKQLATKGPELYQSFLEPKIEEAGGIGQLAKQATGSSGLKGMAVGKAAESVVGKITGGGGGGKADGTGRGRRLPIQEAIDVGVPVDVAYNEWTQFENFPEFMHRVEQIEQIDDTHLVWHENIWGRRRKWKAEITDQTPNERIAWRSEEGTENVGVVTFHDMGDRLTRILVNLDFQPKGVMEKTASGLRMSRRALRSDLMRFKAHIEMQDEEEGAWRGTVEDGEVVDYDEDYENPRDADEDDQSDEYDEEEPDEQADEYEDDEGEEEEPDEQADEYEDDEDEEEEPDELPPPARRRSSARKAVSRPAKKASSTARKTASRPAKKASSTARKTASRPAKKASSTAKKTAKKASSSTRKTASGTAKKASSSTRKTASRPAKKASSTAKKTAKKASSSTRKTASRPAKKATSTARKTASRPAKKSASRTSRSS